MKKLIICFLIFGTKIVYGLQISNGTKAKLVDKDDGKSSLVFVFDTTGSMFNDLRQLREGAEMILNTALEESNIIADFVFVPFHDPNIGPATVTNNKDVFKAALNIVRVYGGGDCPEKSLGGIHLALNVSRPRSYVYVFTDATAADHRMVGKVLDAVQRKQSQVVFVLTGHCNDLKKPSYKVYQQIATASSGQVFNLNKTNVHKVLDFVRSSIRGRNVNLGSAVHAAGYNYTQEIPVDSSLGEMTVSVSGAKPKIKVVNPSGEELTGPPKLVTTLDLSEIMIVRVLEPEAGNWTVTVGSEKDYSVKVSGLSNFTFNYGFSVEKPASMEETSYRPLQGTYNHMLVRLPPTQGPVLLQRAALRATDGSALFELPLHRLAAGLYLADAFLPPDHFFYVAISGRDEHGQELRRLGATAVQAKPPDAPYLTAPEKIEAHSHERVVLKCYVESLVPVTAKWSKDSALLRQTSSLQSTSIEYIIEDMSEGHAGTYRCAAGNVAGSSGTATELTLIVEPPQVTVLPVNASVSAGEEFTISCSVFSEALLLKSQIVFTRNGTVNVTNIHVRPSIDGFYSYNKTIPNASERDEGMYTCVAANRGGVVNESTHITLDLAPTARILGPYWRRRRAPAAAQLACRVERARAAQWLAPGGPLRRVAVRGARTAVLELRGLTAGGRWTCVAYGDTRNASDSIQLEILTKPNVTIEGEKNLTIFDGSTRQVVCTVVANPAPRIIWHKETEAFLNNTVTEIEPTVYRSVLTLDSEKEEVGGTYFCFGENSVGIGQDSITVTARRKMVLLRNFTEQAVELHAAAALRCGAAARPAARARWLHNGTALRPADDVTVSDDGTLHLRSVDFHHQGLYSCVLDNGYETIVVNGTLRVVGLESPVLAKEPSKITTQRGRSAIITCRVIKGNPKPNIVWQHRSDETEEYKEIQNNVVVNDEGYKITIENSSLVDGGMYRCTAENVIGKDTYEAMLIVQYPPELNASEPKLSEKSQLKLEAGGKVVLSCGAVGNPPPIVVWTKEWRPVTYSKDVYLTDSNDLVMENATVFHSGVYNCNATSPLGSVQRNYTVDVYMAPQISPAKVESAIEVVEGQLVQLPCAARGQPPPRVVWRRAGRAVAGARRRADQSALRFVANLTDFGEYTCIASNEYGSAMLNYTVYVWVAPSLQPPLLETRNVVIGTNVTLQCDAVGFPVPVILWEFNGELLMDNTTNLSFNDVGNVYLRNVSSTHEGRYDCIAENLAGLAGKTIILNVYEPPTILQDSYTGPYIATELDTALVIACRATGKPTPYVLWYKDEYYLNNDARYAVGPDGALTVRSPSAELGGRYTCVATNAVGNATTTVAVQIYAVPTAMHSEESPLVVTVVEGTDVTIDCPIRAAPSDTVKWYKEAVLVASGGLRLRPAARAHGGAYACVSRGAAGASHAALRVRVQRAPSLAEPLAEPLAERLRLVRGQDVLLRCDADAAPEPETKWYFNSKLLMGETGSRLRILDVQPRHSGAYRCRVSNLHGAVGKEFLVDVLVPPYISDFDVLDVQLKEGTNATLECNARGSPQPEIKWIFNNTLWSVQNSTITSGNVSVRSEGVYRCDATNAAGRASLVYTVGVLAAAQVNGIDVFDGSVGTTVLDDVEIVLGSQIRIACKASGKPVPTIQWIRHGNTVGSATSNLSYADLLIDKVESTDAGFYTCVASNEAGDDERRIKLDVLEPPRIFQTVFQDEDISESGNIVNLEIISGKAFYLHCHPYGNPLPEIYWFKDDLPLRLFDQTMVSSDFGEIIQSPSAKHEQSGNYTCVARNKVGETGLVYLVDVLVPPPQPKESTKEVNTRIGRQLNLTCPVEGVPRPYVMWVKDPYIEISEEMPRVHLIDDNVTLLIDSTAIEDSGNYSCVMTNKVGSTEVNFNVVVEKPPCIAGNDGNNTTESRVVALGRSFVLKCDVDGHPPPKISWIKDIQRVRAQRVHVTRVWRGSALAVWAAAPSDAGQYICVAENSAGADSRRFNLRVKVPGKWSAWSQWGFCNVTCGLGYQERSRFCHYIDDDNNTNDKSTVSEKLILDETACKGSTTDKRKCHMPSCEEGEGWSSWSRWSKCSATCGAGTQARSRRCRARSRCPGDNVQIRKCPDLPSCASYSRLAGLDNEVYGSQENDETNIYVPAETIEMDVEETNNQRSSNFEKNNIPNGTTRRAYFDINITENLDHSDRGPCKVGFRHNALDDTCEDIDECSLESNRCHATQLCANAAGGYRCACPRGYVASAPGRRCLDINECEQEIHGCEFACVNVAGGYVCACPRHLRLHVDRHHCVTPSLYKKPLYNKYEEESDDYLSAAFDFPATYTKYNRYN